MTYIRKHDRKVIIEVYSEAGRTRTTLRNAGFVFTEEDVLNNRFWGTRFVIDKPRGKGTTARLNLLEAIGSGRHKESA